MSSLHIVSTGTSIISNYEKACADTPDFNPMDQGRLRNFLDQDPCRASAEINSLHARTGFLDANEANDLSVTILHSTTEKGQRTAAVLKRFLGDFGVTVQALPFTGFDRPAKDHYPPSEAAADASRSLHDLQHKLTDHITRMKRQFDRIQINCTGGFKAESAILYRVGLGLEIPVYYMHESFRCCIDLPGS